MSVTSSSCECKHIHSEIESSNASIKHYLLCKNCSNGGDSLSTCLSCMTEYCDEHVARHSELSLHCVMARHVDFTLYCANDFPIETDINLGHLLTKVRLSIMTAKEQVVINNIQKEAEVHGISNAEIKEAITSMDFYDEPLRLLPPLEKRQKIFTKGKPSVEAIISGIRSGRFKRIVVVVGKESSSSSKVPDVHMLQNHVLHDFKLAFPDEIKNQNDIFSTGLLKSDPNIFYAYAKTIFPGKFRPTSTHNFIRILYERGVLLRCYTENIDGLERMAGIPIDSIVEANGSFVNHYCIDQKCKAQLDVEVVWSYISRNSVPTCPLCKSIVRPGIVFSADIFPRRFTNLHLVDMKRADLVIFIGASLNSPPFDCLPDFIRTRTPRLVINHERICDMNQSQRELYPDKQSGFLYSYPDNYRDVFLQSSSEDAIRKIGNTMGWDVSDTPALCGFDCTKTEEGYRQLLRYILRETDDYSTRSANEEDIEDTDSNVSDDSFDGTISPKQSLQRNNSKLDTPLMSKPTDIKDENIVLLNHASRMLRRTSRRWSRKRLPTGMESSTVSPDHSSGRMTAMLSRESSFLIQGPAVSIRESLTNINMQEHKHIVPRLPDGSNDSLAISCVCRMCQLAKHGTLKAAVTKKLEEILLCTICWHELCSDHALQHLSHTPHCLYLSYKTHMDPNELRNGNGVSLTCLASKSQESSFDPDVVNSVAPLVLAVRVLLLQIMGSMTDTFSEKDDIVLDLVSDEEEYSSDDSDSGKEEDDLVEDICKENESVLLERHIDKSIWKPCVCMPYIYDRSELTVLNLWGIADALKANRFSRIMVIVGRHAIASSGAPSLKQIEGDVTGLQWVEEARLCTGKLPTVPDLLNAEAMSAVSANPMGYLSYARAAWPGLHLPTTSLRFLRSLSDHNTLLRVYTENDGGMSRLVGLDSSLIVESVGSLTEFYCTTPKCPTVLHLGDPLWEKEVAEPLLSCEMPRCPRCRVGILRPGVAMCSETMSRDFHAHYSQDTSETDFLIILGSDLDESPVSTLIDMIPASVPRLLINPVVVRRMPDLMRESDSDKLCGFLFGYGDNYRDVYVPGQPDAVCKELLNILDWELPPIPKETFEFHKHITELKAALPLSTIAIRAFAALAAAAKEAKNAARAAANAASIWKRKALKIGNMDTIFDENYASSVRSHKKFTSLYEEFDEMGNPISAGENIEMDSGTNPLRGDKSNAANKLLNLSNDYSHVKSSGYGNSTDVSLISVLDRSNFDSDADFAAERERRIRERHRMKELRIMKREKEEANAKQKADKIPGSHSEAKSPENLVLPELTGDTKRSPVQSRRHSLSSQESPLGSSQETSIKRQTLGRRMTLGADGKQESERKVHRRTSVSFRPLKNVLSDTEPPLKKEPLNNIDDSIESTCVDDLPKEAVKEEKEDKKSSANPEVYMVIPTSTLPHLPKNLLCDSGSTKSAVIVPSAPLILTSRKSQASLISSNFTRSESLYSPSTSNKPKKHSSSTIPSMHSAPSTTLGISGVVSIEKDDMKPETEAVSSRLKIKKPLGMKRSQNRQHSLFSQDDPLSLL